MPPFLLSLSALIRPSGLPSICQSIYLSGDICHFSCHLNHPPISPSIFQALRSIAFQRVPRSFTSPSCLLCAPALLPSERLLRRCHHNSAARCTSALTCFNADEAKRTCALHRGTPVPMTLCVCCRPLTCQVKHCSDTETGSGMTRVR